MTTTIASLILAAAVPAGPSICNVEVCPERENDCAWENDKFGMRAYGPGEYHKWSGFDVFNKGKDAVSVASMLHHPRACGDWHNVPWKGVLDNYTMGPSRGVGGIAMFADGEWKTFPDWESFKEIHKGPDFCEFEIVYPAFSAAGKMTCHITLKAGERFFRNDVSFERMPKGFVAGPGLDLEPKRDHKGDLVTEDGLVSLFEDPKGANGSTMAAVFTFPGEKVETLTDPNNCRVFGFRGQKSFTYWAGASWSLAGEITTPEAWHKEVRRYRSALIDPVAVSRRITEQFLTTSPDSYKPFGVAFSYGKGKQIFYAVASLWVNALENARAFGEKDLEDRLVKAFEPYLNEKAGLLRGVKHVDMNVVGAVPLAIARLTGDARAKEHGLRLADFQWQEPKADDDTYAPYGTFEERVSWWKQGYSDETRLWIDDMYMINLLQTQAYRLTGDRKYVDRAAKEMCLYLEKLQLENGLFYHASDVPFVWGRGAGWMAAGMPLVLACLDKDHPHYAQILAGYRKMMAALLKYQRADGLWGQLVNEPDSWGETSGSAMFAYGLAAGVRHGWLDRAEARSAVDRAWRALCARMDAHANVAGVCVGTNKKNDHQYYLDRPRFNGDPHGQAPMLWLAGELVADERK